jgi:hypothetical protein
VIGFAALDNLLLLSTKKSVLEQKYFRFEDVNIGDVTEVFRPFINNLIN